MATSRCTRRLQTRLTGSLQHELPMTMGGSNFAAFCGTQEQRRQTLLQAVSRYCGRCGIVVLHDDPQLETMLSALPQQLAAAGSAAQNFQIHTLQRKNYDPLYGLDEDAVVNLLLPCDENTYPSAELQQVRAGLMAYLSIMQYRFRQSPQLFGAYPFNLDLLMQLIQMPFVQLDSDVLSYLPASVAGGLRPVLSRSGMQQNVHAAVLPYATAMAKYYWTPSGVQGHSRLSIVQAVQARQMICLRIPGSRQDVMNWLCTELQMLADRGLPFLLVSAELQLTRCRRMQSWFLHHSGANQYLGLLAPSMDSVAGGAEDVSAVFSRYDQIFVYRCSSTAQAAPFSHNYGEYERRQTERSRQTYLPFPWLLPTFGGGRQVRHTTEPNIRAEELMDMRNGVFLCGARYPIPVLIRRFQLPGGDRNVLSLP